MRLTMIEEMGMEMEMRNVEMNEQKCEDGDVGAKRYVTNHVWIALQGNMIAGDTHGDTVAARTGENKSAKVGLVSPLGAHLCQK